MTYRWTPIDEPRERRHDPRSERAMVWPTPPPPLNCRCVLVPIPPRRRYAPPLGHRWQRRLTATKRLQAARRGAK